MLWMICAVVIVLLLAISVKVYLGKKNGVSRAVIVLGCLVAATFIGYMPPFYTAYGLLPGAMGDLIHTLQVVTLNVDITEFYETIISENNEIFAYGYILLLGILHIALPAISAVTAVTVLLRCFSSMQMFFANHRRQPMFVFSEMNERSLHLAKSLGSKKCDIVFANSTEEILNGEIKSEHGVIYKEETISELASRFKEDVANGKKRGKDIYFFCLSEDEDLSLGYSLQMIECFSSVGESCQERIHIYQFSKHRDLSVFIDSADKGALDVQCINEYEVLIYNLLDRYPLMKYQSLGVHVLLHGLSEMNVAALKAIAWCGQISDFSLRISVVGIHISDRVETLRLDVPGLFTDRYDIRFYNCQNEKEITDTIKQKCFDANYIIVGEKSDNATMELGILLRRLFYKMDGEFASCPPIFCYIKDPAKSGLTKKLSTAESNPKRKVNYDLIPFGSLDEIFTYERLVDSPLEKLAKNVHLGYEEIFSDGEIDVKSALKRYNVFEVNKRSNRANALHIRYKLHMLGLDYTDDPDAEEVRLEDCYTEETLEKMSIAEHNRWMAFLETEGWIPSEREDVLAYRNSGISRGRHNCPILKMHPYICEYEKLKDLSLELEGKDTTVYDKELIVRIPDILGDKWNVSGKKYKIVKLR